MKVMGQENLSDDQLNQLRDQVWQSYVQYKLIEKECDKLGLTVTDGEMQNVLNEGTNQMLLSTPFVNRQTGRFDANQLKQFLAQYNQIKTPTHRRLTSMRQSTSIGLTWRRACVSNSSSRNTMACCLTASSQTQ